MTCRRTRVGEGRPAWIMGLFVGLVVTSACGLDRQTAPSRATRAKGEEGTSTKPKSLDSNASEQDKLDHGGRELAYATAAPSSAPPPPAVKGEAGGASPSKERRDPAMAWQAPAARPAAEPYRNDGAFGGSRTGQPHGAGIAAADETVPTEAPRDATIDPNGRFATTYRPGGGHLAAFESAVARGLVPSGEQEIVSDIGARYAPALAKPKDKALAVQADLERSKVAPSGGPLHVRIDLQSTAEHAADRPHLSVVVVLDVSGSMRGELISSARKAAADLVDKLAPTDDFSLVTFSSEAQLRLPMRPVGSHRDSIKKTISEIVEGGGTNIGEGLRLGYEQAKDKRLPEDAMRVVMLLSDGRANDGITNQNELSRLALGAFQDGIQTSSFGLGTDYDGPLMSSIANDGAGGYYYLRDPQQIGPALATELDKRLDPVATALEVRVRLKPGIDLLDAYGSRRLNDSEASRVRTIEVAADQQAEKRDHIKANRKNDLEGGMRFFIPAFARDESHAILLKLRLPEGVGPKDIALLEVKYKDRVKGKNVAEEIPVSVAYADSDSESAKTIDPSVARTVQGFAAGETLMLAANAIQRGDRARAVALIGEREGILDTAAVLMNEPLFISDAQRLERLRVHAAEPSGPMADPLVLAMAMETAGNVHMR